MTRYKTINICSFRHDKIFLFHIWKNFVGCKHWKILFPQMKSAFHSQSHSYLYCKIEHIPHMIPKSFFQISFVVYIILHCTHFCLISFTSHSINYVWVLHQRGLSEDWNENTKQILIFLSLKKRFSTAFYKKTLIVVNVIKFIVLPIKDIMSQ